jgi:hypothetical protein
MDQDRDRRPTRASSGGGIDSTTTGKDWRVLALSAAGIFFIALGLVIFALPDDQEGAILWQLGPEHAFRVMDLAAAFTTALGVALTWLSGMLWQRCTKP